MKYKLLVRVITVKGKKETTEMGTWYEEENIDQAIEDFKYIENYMNT